MSEHAKLEIVNESPKSSGKDLDPKVLEQVFGSPNSPKNNASDSNMINLEKSHIKPHPNGKRSDDHSQPLLEPDREKQKPPLAGPEVDDLDEEVAAHNNNHHFVGIDDGLLEPGNMKPDIVVVGDENHDDEEKQLEHDGATEDGNWWSSGDELDHPYDHTNGLSPRFGAGDNRPVSPVPSIYSSQAIDVNTYQQKKNLAQGMMDLALLSANANQLRYVLESATTHPYYYSSLVFISLSIIFQIAVGVGLIMNSRYDVNDKKEICKADKINNFTVLGIFLITIVNVFITSFSVATPTTLSSVTVATVPAG